MKWKLNGIMALSALMLLTSIEAVQPNPTQAAKDKAIESIKLGNVHYRAREWAQAIADYKKILELQGTETTAAKALKILEGNKTS